MLQSRVVGGKALLLGVRRFADRVSTESESPLEHRNRAPLPFVDEVLARVRDALDVLGFCVDVRLDPDRDRMVDFVRGALEDDSGGDDSGSLVLHVVSHGEVGVDDTRLDVVPACGRTGLGTNVDRLAADGLGADPSTPYVPLGIVGPADCGTGRRLRWAAAARARHPGRPGAAGRRAAVLP